MHCADCGHENAPRARRCAKCGSPLKAKCPDCKTSLPAGANFCPGCGRPVETAATVVAAKERRQVTVMFADLADFTTLVHKSDAEDILEIMGRLWVKVDELIAAHGGITEKHIGDAVIAIFGALEARE